jgi:hypothetical protein
VERAGPDRSQSISLVGRRIESVFDVSARAESAEFPVIHPVRWLLLPMVGWAVVATVARVLRQRAKEPSVPPMSDEWLRNHESSSGRSGD